MSEEVQTIEHPPGRRIVQIASAANSGGVILFAFCDEAGEIATRDIGQHLPVGRVRAVASVPDAEVGEVGLHR